MAKSILFFVIGGVPGAAAGFAAGIFVYPYIFLADAAVRAARLVPGVR